MIAVLPTTVVAEGGGIIGDPRVTDAGQLVTIPLQVSVPALIFDCLAITAVPVETALEAGAGIGVITLVMFLLAIVVVRVCGQEPSLTWVFDDGCEHRERYHLSGRILVPSDADRSALPGYAKYYLVKW